MTKTASTLSGRGVQPRRFRCSTLSRGSTRHNAALLRSAAGVSCMLLLVVAVLPACGNPPGDWNGDGLVDADDYQALSNCFSGPGIQTSGPCDAFDADADGDVDLDDYAAIQEPAGGCVLHAGNLEPVDWLDTAPNNSMAADDTIFQRWCVDEVPVLGTVAGLNNVHSHYIGGDSASWSGYELTGRMRVDDPAGAVGLTFYSDYPNSDAYYRLSADSAWTTFHIRPHPLGDMLIDGGEDDSGVVRVVGAWFRFRIDVQTEASRTTIRAKVWPDGAAEPGAWQIDCYDDSPDRLTQGTYGVWVWGPGDKYWDDLVVTLGDCADQDTDGDGVSDCADACPADPDKVAPGTCGCGRSDVDENQNGTADCLEFDTMLTPIARWDVVPRQRINAGEVFNAGVVAFSKHGIERVRFHISGQGYSGASPVDVTEMSYNPQTDVWEYWTPIAADDFTGDGAITVEAVVYGNDGGVRDKNTTPGDGLESLRLFVNPHGTMLDNTAWVATSGNDTTGKVNDSGRPYRSISAAMQALAAHQGGFADGGIVRLRPGHHAADCGGIYGDETAPTAQEWITITSDPAAGGNWSNTFIDSRASGDLTSYWLKVADLTLAAPAIINGGNSSDADRWNRSVWLKDCHLPGGSGDFPFPVGSGWRGPHYYTECTIDNMRRACGNGQNHKLMRNLTITNTREDVFQGVPFGINIRVDGCDPGSGADPEHADVIQGPPALETERAFIHNWIWYNVVATDLHYQGIFVRSGATSMNNAFVNCLFEMRAPIRNNVGDGRGTSFAGKYDHLLLWNCSFIGTDTINKFSIGKYESTTSPAGEYMVANASIRGCLFQSFRSTVRSADKAWVNKADVEICDNHYVLPEDSADPHRIVPTCDPARTTGSPQVVSDTASADFGRPTSGSPLVNRINPPLVPADADGRPHGTAADVGALAR